MATTCLRVWEAQLRVETCVWNTRVAILQSSILRDGMSVQICIQKATCASAIPLKVLPGSLATMCTHCKSPACCPAAAQVEDVKLPPKRSFGGVPKLVEQFLDALATGQATWEHPTKIWLPTHKHQIYIQQN